MNLKTLFRRSWVLIVIALLFASFMLGRGLNPVQTGIAQAVDPQSPATAAYDSGAMPEATAQYLCPLIQRVAQYTVAGGMRIHLRCSVAPATAPAVFYFAFNQVGQASGDASRYIALGSTAFALGKGGWITYDTLTSHNPPGCQAGDCRLLVGLDITP